MTSFQDIFFKKHSSQKIAILLLQQGETVQIPLTGRCMKPFLHENDLITIEPINPEKLICGDVAVFQFQGMLKAHRFLKRKVIEGEKYLITKGDRRFRYDDPVPFKNLLGKIIQVKRREHHMDYTLKKWRRMNYMIGKLTPFLTFVEYPYSRNRRMIVKCIRTIVGENYKEH
jgi:hypothetical protein